MSALLRPEVAALLRRWREPLAAGAAVAGGLWIASLGGWLLIPVGLLLAALAAAWGWIALRRVRFLGPAGAPGLVEVDEGQVGYLGPDAGGFVALDEIEELRLVVRGGRRFWRLRQTDGATLMIPVGTAGGGRLFDAFASLPGMDLKALVAALDEAPGALGLSSDAPRIGPVIWRRPARHVLT